MNERKNGKGMRAITRRRRPQGRKLKRRVLRFALDDASYERFNRRSRGIIIRALQARLPKSRAAELAGISVAILRGWLKKGLELEGDDTHPINPIFVSFRRKVKAVEAEHEAEALRRIELAAQGGHKVTETKVRVKSLGPVQEKEIIKVQKEVSPVWQADAWWLERTKRATYGREAIDTGRERTPEESAADIKRAADALFNSVPTGGAEALT